MNRRAGYLVVSVDRGAVLSDIEAAVEGGRQRDKSDLVFSKSEMAHFLKSATLDEECQQIIMACSRKHGTLRHFSDRVAVLDLQSS
jgi:hypothetical protein